MLTLKSITFISLITGVFGHSSDLRQLIVRVHGKSDSATVNFIGIDGDFLSDFMKEEVSIPILTFNTEYTEEFGQGRNGIIVFQVPEKDQIYSKVLPQIIENLLVRKFVIVSAITFENLNQYFCFFGARRFTRIFGIIGNSSSYAYLPFAQNSVEQLVENGHLPDALKDLNGFAIRTTIQADAPRTFWYPHEGGQRRIGGRVGQLFLHFLKRYNGTFEEIILNNSTYLNVEAVANATINHDIDISMNVYFQQPKLDISYPVRVEELIIMVPCNGLISPHEYFQRPFSSEVWICIGLSLGLIIFSKFILDSLTTPRADIWSCFSITYLILLNLPTERPITSCYRFYLVVLCLAFIIGRLFGSLFQSFLTVYIKIKQFDTIQDLVDNNISVMISTFRWTKIRDDYYPKGFEKIVLPTPEKFFISQFMSMRNTSFAYASDADRCQYYMRFQSLYRKSLFRRAREIINSNYIGFLIPYHSLFKEILNNFIIEITQTGLIQKWDSDVIYQAKAGGFGKEIYTDDEDAHRGLHVPLTLHHLQFAQSCLMIGLAISTGAFILECIFSKVRKIVLKYVLRAKHSFKS